MGDFNISINRFGEATFFVKPFSKNARKELNRIIEFCKSDNTIGIYEENGVYAIVSYNDYKSNFFNGLWGILYRKYVSESQKICVDPSTKKLFYPVIISDKMIAPGASPIIK